MGQGLGFCLSLAMFAAVAACGGSTSSTGWLGDDGGTGGAGRSGGTSGAGGSGGTTGAAGSGGTTGAAGVLPDAGRAGGDASTDGPIDGSLPSDANAGDADADGPDAGACTPNAKLCVGQVPQTCDASGTWQSGPACVNQACVAGACTGVCAPGTPRCSANAVQACLSTGQWGPGMACSWPTPVCVGVACDNATLSVVKNGTGTGSVTSSPAGIACGATCSGAFASSPVVLTATPAAGSTFTGWSGGGCSGTGTCSVSLLAGDAAVTATFTSVSGSLSCTTVANATSCTNGVIAEINLGATSSTACHDQCQPAMASAGMTTGCWVLAPNGNCYCRSGVLSVGGVNPGGSCGSAQVALTVSKAGAGLGTVTSVPAGINCGATCSASYDFGASVVLTASPAAGSTFTGWSGGGCSGTGTCTVSMLAATAVTATFSGTGFLCTTVANAASCTNGGTFAERNLGAINATSCHDGCQALEAASGTASGCWVLAINGNCYCRGGVLNLGGTSPGGACN
jgi:hypothetical protein